MARSMLSVGMLEAFAVVTAVRRRGLALMSPPPIFAATVISLISLVKILPRLASFAAFLCLIVLHFEWPDMRLSFPLPRRDRREFRDGVPRFGAPLAVDGSFRVLA